MGHVTGSVDNRDTCGTPSEQPDFRATVGADPADDAAGRTLPPRRKDSHDHSDAGSGDVRIGQSRNVRPDSPVSEWLRARPTLSTGTDHTVHTTSTISERTTCP
ncbi:hypothetical protein GCM10009848_35900 [Micromonospora lupini]